MSAGYVNKVTLIGNLGGDPEVRAMGNGKNVVTFGVATTDTWTDRGTGERKEVTEWHRIVIFSEKLGDVASEYLRKGAKVYLEGKLRTRKWQDQAGIDRYSTEVVLDGFEGRLTFMDGRRDGDDRASRAGGGGGDRSGDRAPRRQPPPAGAGAGGGFGAADGDDDIPFGACWQ
jgi:single-strand DNA-binding protein